MKRMLRLFALAVLALALLCGAALADGPANLEAVLADFNLGDEMLPLDMYDLVDLYFFDSADMKQAAAAVHTSGLNCDMIILIEAVDSGAAANVKATLDGIYNAKLNETKNYLPEQYAILQQCSVTVNGNYVALIVAPNAAELVEIYDRSFE